MNCAWKELLAILPVWMRKDVDMLGKERLTELRLRLDAQPELNIAGECIWLCRIVTADDLSFCINAASQYSPWAAETEAEGYITAPGGHRIGICGETVINGGRLTGYKKISSLCIRVARDFSGIWTDTNVPLGSFLLLGAPGWGKTTLLRDCIRILSQDCSICVIDERGELFPTGFQKGKRMDVMTGCPKSIGIGIVLRTMCPSYIAVDEITAQADSAALIRAVGCGVQLAATAHASSFEDFCRRPVYQPLLRYRLFDTIVQLHQDRTYTIERITL